MSGSRWPRSERSPDASSRPSRSASAHSRSPTASAIQVGASSSTAAGGVPAGVAGALQALRRGVRRDPDLDRAAGRPGHQQREQVLGQQPEVVVVRVAGAEPGQRGADDGGVGGAETDGHAADPRARRRPRKPGVSHRCNSSDRCYCCEFCGYSDSTLDALEPLMPAAVPALLPRRRRTARPRGRRGRRRPGRRRDDAAPPPRAGADNRVTPGSFTGYGFDQCTAPTQRAMDAWRTSSPYWAVGIYVSGASRGCLSQPNLTPTWVRRQLAGGWRLLPITLGPQASCTTRERYLHQVRINPSLLGRLRPGALPGPGGGPQDRGGRPPARASPGAARSGTTSRRSPPPGPGAASRR